MPAGRIAASRVAEQSTSSRGAGPPCCQGSSKLTERDLVAWDCQVCFGLRPVELQGLQLRQGENGTVVANVTHAK